MKIGFDAKRYFNNSSGLGNYARWLVDGLAKRQKCEYHLYQPKEVSQKVDLPLHYPSGIGKATPSLWRSKFVCSRLETDKIDIFHGLSNEIPFGIHKTNIKSVVTIHDLINKRYPENYGTVDRIIYNKKLYYAQKYAAKIITPSKQTKEDIITFYGTTADKIEVVPLSLQKKTFTIEASGMDSEYMLCVSGFTKRKNISLLVKAYTALENCSTKLIIAGHDGDSFKEVQQLASNNPNIILRQNVEAKELNTLYQNALFCVYPSVFEGFGIPILEAFSFGKTVATSNISSMPEVGGDAAVYFNPTDTTSISSALEKLLIPKNRNALEERIVDRLAAFETQKLLNRYEEIYEELLLQ
ncbi:MAG: glycosyltransferase family 1 protein [Bacteroidia bacterium]|jgi:glycosyltransferase involved in cell wall biosynthesis|nr:glycosyltransferase family 1 protein [Bacteroidia bacterium]